MNTYDIFLVPAESQFNKYSDLINSLSNKYKTPSFPHITLVEKVEAEEDELIEKVGAIAQILNKVEVEVFGMNFSNTINQCVFAQIKMSPQLLSLYIKLAEALQYPNKSPFFPHMSLVYGDFSPEEKSNIAKQIKIDDKLLLDKIVIYRDGPLPIDWGRVAEFKIV